MKYIKYLIILMFANFSVCGFNLIPLEERLINHQKALKDFEQYLSSCKVEVFDEGNITVYDYEFASSKAKESFYNYREKYKNLKARMYKNLLLRGFILGLLTTWHDRYFKEKFLHPKTLVLNFEASIALLIYDNLSRPKEPYIDVDNLTKYDNIFALNDLENLPKIFFILTYSIIGRFAGQVIVEKVLKWD